MNNKEKRLESTFVVITGAVGNLGKVFSESVIRNGGKVFVTDKNSEIVEGFVNELNLDYPGHAYGAALDITSDESLQNCILEIKKIGIIPNALINNALPFNNSYGSKLEDITLENFNENISMHVGGYFNVTNQMIKYFFGNIDASIINISSVYGFKAPDFNIYKGESFTMPLEYAISKSSVRQLTNYYSSYYKDKTIRFNSISPGGISRDHSENFIKNYKNKCFNKGLLNEQDIVGAMIFLLSEESAFVKGQNIVVDDGFSI